MRLPILICVFFSQLVAAQENLNGKYVFKHLKQEDGLLHTNVTDIAQDEKGYMWIMTHNGLQRYDGHQFVNYPETTEYPSSAEPKVGQLIIDTTENYVGAVYFDVMRKLDLTNNTISTVTRKEMSNNEPLISISKDNITLAPHRFWWIGNSVENTGVKGYITSDKERNQFMVKDTVSGEIYLACAGDYAVINSDRSEIEFHSDSVVTHPLLKVLQKKCPLPWQWEGSVMDRHRNLWFYGYTHLVLRYDLDKKQVYSYSIREIKQKYSLPPYTEYSYSVSQVYVDRQGNVWIAVDNGGLFLYDRQKDAMQLLTADTRIDNGLEYGFEINVIYQDRDDNLWIGTDRGISIFNPYRNQLQIIRHQDGNPLSLPRFDIEDVFETEQGEILVGTWGGGLSIFDSEWNFKRQVIFEGGDQPNQIWSFIQDDDGKVWVGVQAGYLHIYDPVTRYFKTIRPPELGSRTTISMAKDHDGNIVFLSHGSKVSVWNKKENKFYAYGDQADTTFIRTNEVNEILVDSQNQVWVSVSFGLKKFDQQKHIFTGNYYLPDKERTTINTFGLEIYNDSLLLVGSFFGGIHLFNTHTFQFEPFIRNKLPESSTVNAIKKDGNGNIWFTTHYHLYKLNQKGELSKLGFNSTMIKNAFGSSRFRELHDGRWVTSTWSEIICFHPKDFNNNPSDISIQITGFHIPGKDLYIDTFLSQQIPVMLKHRENFFSIEFSEMTYNDIQEINYYYRLSDVDRDWVRTVSGKADYTDIKPGEYLFEVKAEQGSGFSKITSFPVMITPPWWATRWFRILCLFALGSLIYFVLKKRIRIIRKEADLKHQVAETKMMALRSQMNPHFIFNCLNTIDNLIQTDQKDKATAYLTKFAKLMRAILDNSKNNVIPAWKDLEALELYLDMETLRWDNKIQYHIDVDPQIRNGDYKIPPMLIQPFVENAIHHGLLNKTGNDKQLSIGIELEGEDIKYTIHDNGVGRAKAAEYKKLNHRSHRSYGIQITKDRIELFNQHQNQSVKIIDLYNEKQEPTGTKVEVWLTTQTQEE